MQLTAPTPTPPPASGARLASPAAPPLAAAPPGAADLLAALEAFRIDDTEAPAWSFTQRLAHEHGWRPAFAERVVVEYKRFLALSALAGHVVCPSEQVDQAWHLHLTYTRSYWDRLCAGVLGRPLHHAPTAGGAAEHAKHLALYDRTLESYRRVFGAAPPIDIWPPPAVRFGADLHVVRVNPAHTWIIDKTRALQLLAVGAAAVAAGLVSWLTA
jgi:hypothetical protein